MKKILKAIALIVCLVFPLSAMAMSTMDDNDMSTVTGQAGVSINLDANINLHIDTVAWGDKDGLGTTEASGAGWIGLQTVDANGIRIRARQDLLSTAFANVQGAHAFATVGPAFVGAYNTAGFGPCASVACVLGDSANASTVTGWATFYADYQAYSAYNTASAAFIPLTIDVATDGTHGAGITFVRIGLGSIELGVHDMTATVALGGGATTPTLNQQLGSLYLAGLLVNIKGTSYVDIYNDRGTGKQGVTMYANVVLDNITLNTMTWGDSNGFDNTLTTNAPLKNTGLAGYVGLQGTYIDTLSVVGALTVDVATDDGSTAGFKQAGINTTFVRLGFASLAVGMNTLDTTVVLSDTNDLSGNVYTLGSVYMKTLAMTVGGSVDIWNKNTKDGVVIDLNATVGMTLNTLAWGDSDGLTNNSKISTATGLALAGNLVTGTVTTNQGWVGLKSLNITNLGLSGQVTIDVATVVAGDTSSYAVGTSFVRIGFNALNVSMTSMTATAALGASKTNLNQELGSIYLGGLSTSINGSVDISAPATGQGVVINLGLSPSTVTIGAVSWGDSDGTGIAGSNSPGYVGLKTLAITGLQVAGKITIDVATVNAAAASGTVPAAFLHQDDLMYAAYDTHNLSPTFVHIGFGTGNANNAPGASSLILTIGTLAADVRLDSAPTLANTANGALGSLYLSNMTAKVNGWIDIAAH